MSNLKKLIGKILCIYLFMRETKYGLSIRIKRSNLKIEEKEILNSMAAHSILKYKVDIQVH